MKSILGACSAAAVALESQAVELQTVTFLPCCCHMDLSDTLADAAVSIVGTFLNPGQAPQLVEMAEKEEATD